jgi:hypothetical protein
MYIKEFYGNPVLLKVRAGRNEHDANLLLVRQSRVHQLSAKFRE